MRVVHGIAWYAPESWGGTEQYVSGLARALEQRGISSIVIAPQAGAAWREYAHDGLRVVRFPLEKECDGQPLVDWFRHSGADAFHLHSWTPACGVSELDAAREAGLRTVLTIHIAAPVCARGTMMRSGTYPCDGRILERRCATCWIESRGVPAPIARAVATIPADFGSTISKRLGTSSFRHAFAARTDMRNRLADLHAAAACADNVIVVSEWLRDSLIANGVPASKLVLCRHGVEASWVRELTRTRKQPHAGFRVLCVGRWDSLKGQHILVDAWSRLADSQLRLRFVAPPPASDESMKYREEVVALARGDPRIEFASAESREALRAEFAAADLLAVPSQTFETGPLVALEARALGLPVLGSRLGGLQELITPGVDGWLVTHDDVTAWADSIESISRGRGLERAVETRAVRTMDDVAAEMVAVYSVATRAGCAA